MKIEVMRIALLLLLCAVCGCFMLKPRVSNRLALKDSSDVEAEAAPIIPTYLPSECGIDYVPLATMLATGDFLSADQFTRDNLIKIAGSEKAGRNFVYWTEVKNIPETDLATMERLWLEFSNGKYYKF